MFDNLLPVLRDVIVIGYLFVLRIGIPIIITLFVGWWLERKLTEWDAKEIAELKKQQAQAKAQDKKSSELPLHM